MSTVGVRELKEQASRIVRRVSEDGEPIDITVRGEVVARLIPMRRRRIDPAEDVAAMARRDRLAAEVAKYWPKGLSAADAIKEDRREL